MRRKTKLSKRKWKCFPRACTRTWYAIFNSRDYRSSL